jgi:hypothetical protein
LKALDQLVSTSSSEYEIVELSNEQKTMLGKLRNEMEMIAEISRNIIIESKDE